jgi:hypothetical protein
VLDSCAGQVLWGGFGRRHEISYKGEADLVTEANEEAQRKIEEILRETFPNHGMLTEEGGETDGQSEARWVVDPLDGTTNYAHGVPAVVGQELPATRRPTQRLLTPEMEVGQSVQPPEVVSRYTETDPDDDPAYNGAVRSMRRHAPKVAAYETTDRHRQTVSPVHQALDDEYHHRRAS